MSAPEASIYDYSTGVPRRHHSLYIEDGNLVFQVENAIFKVHRFFLAKYSSVIRDMLSVPQETICRDEIDRFPLILNGDSAEGWQLLLEDIYARQPLKKSQAYSGEGMVAILSIAHKYCMESIEETVIEHLKEGTTTEHYVDLMVASRIVDSEELYQKALEGLIRSETKPTLVQARKIGLDAYHALTVAAASTASQSQIKLANQQCSYCRRLTRPHCGNCCEDYIVSWCN